MSWKLRNAQTRQVEPRLCPRCEKYLGICPNTNQIIIFDDFLKAFLIQFVLLQFPINKSLFDFVPSL